MPTAPKLIVNLYSFSFLLINILSSFIKFLLLNTKIYKNSLNNPGKYFECWTPILLFSSFFLVISNLNVTLSPTTNSVSSNPSTYAFILNSYCGIFFL